MSIRAIDWAFRQQVGSSATKLVLVKLADNANDDGQCWPSLATIEDQTELDRRTVIRHIKKLQSAGLLNIVHRKVDSTTLTNAYTLNLSPVVSGCHRGGDSGVLPSPSPSPTTPTSTTPLKKTTMEPGEFPPFELIWQAYPAERRCARKPAYSAIRHALRRSGMSADDLLRIVKRFARVMDGEAPAFIPMLTTWMNQDRYEWKDDAWNPNQEVKRKITW